MVEDAGGADGRSGGLPAATIAWVRSDPPLDEYLRFARHAGRRDLLATLAGGVVNWFRMSALVVGAIVLFTALLRATGYTRPMMPRWTWIVALAGVASFVPAGRGTRTRKMLWLYGLTMAAGATGALLGLWWWLAWAVPALFITFSTVIGTFTALAICGRRRFDLEAGG